MIVHIDIHTHCPDTNNPLAVRNLSVNEAEGFVKTDKKEFCSIGIHPWDVHLASPEIMQKLESFAADKRVVAIGECGLDKNSKASIKEQDYFFERQIMLSEKIQKPLIIHCVASFNEIIAMKKRHKPEQTWIIHGFRGKPELAKQLLSSGFALSFGEKFNPASVEITPINKLCIETDESQLPIEQIYKNIALIKACRSEELNGACQLLKLFVC